MTYVRTYVCPSVRPTDREDAHCHILEIAGPRGTEPASDTRRGGTPRVCGARERARSNKPRGVGETGAHTTRPGSGRATRRRAREVVRKRRHRENGASPMIQAQISGLISRVTNEFAAPCRRFFLQELASLLVLSVLPLPSILPSSLLHVSFYRSRDQCEIPTSQSTNCCVHDRPRRTLDCSVLRIG